MASIIIGDGEAYKPPPWRHTEPYLTLSEILGHLDLLVSDGRATENASGPVTRFAAEPTGP